MATEVKQEICGVCGDKASGYHYNVLSCEGCKGFFRRSVHKAEVISCKHGRDCTVDILTRKKCPACRLQKCLAVGMQESCLLTENQCNARGSKRRNSYLNLAHKERRVSHNLNERSASTSIFNNNRTLTGSRGDNSPGLTESTATSSDDERESQRSRSTLLAHLDSERLSFDAPFSRCLSELPDELRILLETVLINQEKYAKIPEHKLHRSLICNDACLGGAGRLSDARHRLYMRQAQLTILSTQLIVEFAKQTIDFSEFTVADQISLIKASVFNILTLKIARQYNPATDTVKLTDGQVYTVHTLKYAGLEACADNLFRFCRAMADLEVDDAEFGLLTCICLYSETSAVKDIDRVTQIQEIYSRTLQSYCNHKTSKGCGRFAKLIMKFVHLQELNILQSDIALTLKVDVNDGQPLLPEILQEYFLYTMNS